MQLRAVVERQRVHFHVGPGHLAVHRTRDVLRDEAAMRQHGALGPGLGPAGVDQLGQVVIAHGDIRGRSAVVSHPVRDSLPARVPARGRLFAALRDHAAHGDGAAAPASVARQLPQGLLGHRHQRVPGDQPRGARMPEHVADLARCQHEVDGHGHRAEPGQREVGHHERVVVVAEDRDPVARGDPAGGQRRGGPVHRGVEFGVRLPQAAVDDGGLVRVTRGGPAQQVADRLAPGVHDERRGDVVRHDRSWRLRPARGARAIPLVTA